MAEAATEVREASGVLQVVSQGKLRLAARTREQCGQGIAHRRAVLVQRSEHIEHAARSKLLALHCVEPDDLAGKAEVELNAPAVMALKVERRHGHAAAGTVHASSPLGPVPR